MPLWHCSSCHHEWEGSTESNTCDWCSEPGYILESLTPLEKMLAAMREGTLFRGLLSRDTLPKKKEYKH